MSFLIYFFVLLMSAGAVLFGLDLINSPLRPPPDVPIGRIVRHVATASPASQADGQSETRSAVKRQLAANSARKSAAEQARVEDRALSPVYPASPGPAAPVITTGRASTDEGGATDARAAATAHADSDASNKHDSVKDTAQAKAQNACNVQACNAAYRSFRASDCTYQPYEGSRRLCTKSGADVATAAQAPPRQQAQPPARRAARRDELDEVTRFVRGMPAGEAVRAQPGRNDELSEAARIVRRMTRGRGLGAVPVQVGDGRVIIVQTDGTQAE